jgi:CheY-like chemotaxis protein
LGTVLCVVTDAPQIVPRVLIVDDDDAVRGVVAMTLEFEGIDVVQARCVEHARPIIAQGGIDGVILDRQLPDGDGLDLLPAITDLEPCPTVVIHSTLEDGSEPEGLARVAKGDVDAIVAALTVGHSQPLARQLAVIDLVRREAGDVIEEWRELCRWDPMLPPDANPPVASRIVSSFVEALERPQPLGWGIDPAMEDVLEVYALACHSPTMAVEQLVCLREALVRHIWARIPPDEVGETLARMHMLVDRAIVTAVDVSTARMPARP